MQIWKYTNTHVGKSQYEKYKRVCKEMYKTIK